ncbi:MAG: hypothetical protein IPK82_22900 [Polyangiaceae bacterium]|nr:hypothetical protein [Polyangiaceae bacterium]
MVYTLFEGRFCRVLTAAGVLTAALVCTENAGADVAVAGTHILPSDAVFTGVNDFPKFRFVVAVHSHRPSPEEMPSMPIPEPSAVKEGEPVPIHKVFFQELRAIPLDAPDPVPDAWVLASNAPTSGSFTRHPVRVPIGSDEVSARAYYHVRQVEAGWISVELLGADLLLKDGSKKPHVKVIPVSYAVESFEAEPGWKLFLMPDPKWPAGAVSLPAVRYGVGDELVLTPGPRTLVAVKGDVGPSGSLDGKEYRVWGRPLDAFQTDEVAPESGAVGRQVRLHVEIGSEGKLDISLGERFRNGEGDWFEDADLTFPVEGVLRREHKIALGALGILAIGLLGGGVWFVRRRRKRAGSPS